MSVSASVSASVSTSVSASVSLSPYFRPSISVSVYFYVYASEIIGSVFYKPLLQKKKNMLITVVNSGTRPNIDSW